VIPGQAGGQEQEHRSEALAAGPGDVAAHLLNECHRRVQLTTDFGLDPLEVIPDEVGHALFEDLLERRGRHAAGATSGRRGP